MSKAAKKSIYLLIFLLAIALGYAGVTYMKLQETETAKVMVEQEYADAQNRFEAKDRQNTMEAKKLQGDLAKANNEKSQYMSQMRRLEEESSRKIEELNVKIKEITDDREKWKNRIESIRSERDQLMEKIARLTKELEEKTEAQAANKENEPAPLVNVVSAPAVFPDSSGSGNDQYWAELLKQKASLEVDLQKLKDELTKKSVEVVEINQGNENLQLEVETLRNAQEELSNEIKHKTQMIDNITLELARTKNDKKFIADRAGKLNDENKDLRRQMKQLVSVKNALEKSVVRVTQEKDKIKNELGKTETIIQSKIDEIWDIKDELDMSIRSAQAGAAPNEVELPPIVVSSSGDNKSFNTGEVPSGFNGRVISLNEANNFVIVDIGEDTGIRLGDNLSVYRDSKYIARLEVIQVRKDICAADIKDQWSKIKVGDIIR